MSAAIDEADLGPELHTSDIESDWDDQEAPKEHEVRKNVTKRPTEQFAEEEETANSVVPNLNGYDASQEQDDGMGNTKQSPPPVIVERPSSADGSLSIPNDTPSIQGSVASSTSRQARLSAYGRSPTPSLRPFDRRFQSRIPSSPLSSPRATSPAFLQSHSRQVSVNKYLLPRGEDHESEQAPWEVVRWTRLRKISGQSFSEIGKRNFGRPICIAISTSIALGTSKGIILIFDYNQNLKSIIGPGTKAVETGAVTSVSISADHTTVAGGHATGHIFTWELAKPAKPFLHIPPVDRRRSPNTDGHIIDVGIVHLGFLGMRHTALVSADDKGMAFSHLATRGMGSVARSVKTTRILGRYPEATPSQSRQRKPSSVLAFSPLPLGNADHGSDTMGLVAMLTPYLLVIVSTTPIAQTQYKTPRPKEVAAHSAMTAALAWFPSVKLKIPNPATAETSSRVKLVYCWSNLLTILEVLEVEPSASSNTEGPPNLQFRPRSRWKADEAIVAVQWLGRSVLAVLTITQQLVILEDIAFRQTNSSDLIQKHIYHVDLFSQQLNMVVEQLDEEDASMHGVVADAFYMSFRAYKGRLFLLGFNEITFGQLSNWADRLLALVEHGDHIRAIELATEYYTGQADKVSVGLPEDDSSRHHIVQDKLLEMMSASLRYTFSEHDESLQVPETVQLQELAGVCVTACVSIGNTEYLFDEVYSWFSEAGSKEIFLQTLEIYIIEDDIEIVPPTVIKDLVSYYTDKCLNSRLEELLCHLDPGTMDLDQVTGLCKQNHLYDALLYVWNQALDDYTTILDELLNLVEVQKGPDANISPSTQARNFSSASKIFPYLSYILTSRVYPTGKAMEDSRATLAKAEIYHFFFSGSGTGIPNGTYTSQPSKRHLDSSFPNLRRVIDFDAPSFLSMLNEAFEDSFLNGTHDQISRDRSAQITEVEKSGLSVNRQWIVRILLDIMVPPKYEPEDTVYLNMFIARNLPKFPQFVLLPSHQLLRVLVGLCEYPTDDVAEDCQLSVEYLLSVYQPPDILSLVPLFSAARFYRVLRSVYRSEKDYARLVQTCFDEGPANGNLVFDCMAECLKASTGLSEKQAEDVRQVIQRNADLLLGRDVVKAAAIIEEYAPSLHEDMLRVLDQASNDGREFEYLRTILDAPDPSSRDHWLPVKSPDKAFIELYVRLLCEHNPHHVNEYIERLKTGDLRLEQVLPALESSGVIDAAVILMAREGKVRDAMHRLVQHLDTLEAALLGLLDAAADSPDVANTSEAVHDLVGSIQKFTRVGIWLCQGQTRSTPQQMSKPRQARRAKTGDEDLNLGENLWLDLIDAVVKVTKQVTESPQAHHHRREVKGEDEDEKVHQMPLDVSRVLGELRTVVQEAFTALLSATSGPGAKEAVGADVSFLRILRAFLSRASAISPSLSNLRSVLSSIFSAYSYEERLLALANRLLDQDLFVHVAEANKLRRKGWRPLGQVCEGCGKRLWGPGTGVHVWEAYQRKEEEENASNRQQNHAKHLVDKQSSRVMRNGKGKAIQEDAQPGLAVSDQLIRKRDDEVTASTQNSEGLVEDGGGGEGGGGGRGGGSGSLIVFSCRHLFHRMCLEKMQGSGDTVSDGRLQIAAHAGHDFTCPLCISR
ncbi:MAG: hypothetical protein LQ352_006933 [Teloschistes flavicans]|nr:MAG: hypothetical protein LQ352_006933 [Teloschistes flavicans]